MVGPNAVQLILGEDGEDWADIHALTDLGYDRIAKTGYRFSGDNPHREELIG
jgi:hypothetical protein